MGEALDPKLSRIDGSGVFASFFFFPPECYVCGGGICTWFLYLFGFIHLYKSGEGQGGNLHLVFYLIGLIRLYERVGEERRDLHLVFFTG